MNNFARVKAIQESNKKRLLKVNSGLTNDSGVYILTRMDENGIKYAYIGQAKHILDRLAQHLSGYQHIDLSIKKHKLFSETNVYGWKIDFVKCSLEKLDDTEKFFIKEFANNGYQLRNKTAGGQCEGKVGIDDNKAPKGYYDGLAQGYENCRKEVADYFEKYLDFTIKMPVFNKKGEVYAIKSKKLEEFRGFLNGRTK